MPYQRTIVVSPIPEDLPKYPLNVRASVDPSHVTSTTNIHVFANDGITERPHLLISYDATSGDLDLIVKTPLAAGSNVLYLQYS